MFIAEYGGADKPDSIWFFCGLLVIAWLRGLGLMRNHEGQRLNCELL
jgi:hypothetical protein